MNAEAIVIAVVFSGDVLPLEGFLAHQLRPLPVIGDHDPQGLLGGGGQHGFKAADIMHGIIVADQLIPGCLDGHILLDPGANTGILGDSRIDFLAHWKAPFLLLGGILFDCGLEAENIVAGTGIRHNAFPGNPVTHGGG